MTKIVCTTAIWKRPPITEIVLKHCNELRDQSKADIELIAVGSRGEKSRRMCEKHGFEYIERPNRPLAQKWADVVHEAKKYDPDAVMRIDSDDLISFNYPQVLYDRMKREKIDVGGICELYFYWTKTGEMAHWIDPGKSPNGGSIMFMDDVLEKYDYRPWPKDCKNDSGLDAFNRRWWEPEGIVYSAFLQDELDVSVVSLKSRLNLWWYSDLLKSPDVKIISPLETVRKFMDVTRLR